MRTFLFSLVTVALAGPAFAISELQLGSNMPVVLYLDGESAGTVQPHEPLLIDIESGVHNIRIQGVLGKDLYDRDLIFDNDTRTELVWQRKQLRLGQVVKLDPNRAPSEDSDSGGLPIAPEHPHAPQAPERPAAPVQPEQIAAAPPPPPTKPRRPLARPAEVAEAPPARKVKRQPPPREPAPVLANTAPPVRDVSAPPPVGTAKRGSVVVEAREGLDLQISHGSQLLRITVKNGDLVVIDANGTEIHFPSDGDAW